jgi:SAM-dependent methyltransferase
MFRNRGDLPPGPAGFRADAPFDLAGRLNALVAADATAESAYRGRRPTSRVRRHAPARYRGHPKHCPVCGSRSGYFHAFGRAGRRNAVCPACGSLERHRFLWLHLERALGLPRRRLDVLHVAPEPSIRARLAAAPGLRYTGVDLYRPDARAGEGRMDVTRLALPDRSLDLVICSHVLEHVERDRAALAEFARVLRPGGRAVILVPLDPRRPTVEDSRARTAAQRLAAFGHPYHVRICGNDYGARIAAAGFDVRQVESGALSGHRRRYFRLNKASLFDCRRL